MTQTNDLLKGGKWSYDLGGAGLINIGDGNPNSTGSPGTASAGVITGRKERALTISVATTTTAATAGGALNLTAGAGATFGAAAQPGDGAPAGTAGRRRAVAGGGRPGRWHRA